MALSKRDTINELYKRGILSFKLDSLQKDLHKELLSSPTKINVLLCSRRLGKSYLAVIIAIEQCLREPGSIVKFLAQTKLQIQTILRPLFDEILEDCPSALKPKFRKHEWLYYFPNGSVIQLAGSDNGHAEKLRGDSSDLCIVDEAGNCSDLTNIVRSILIPTTLTTRGKILLLSTPPLEMDHEFFKFMEAAEHQKALWKRTIFDNPRLTKEDIDEIIKPYPRGINDPDFRREYMCEIIKDADTSVVPEFTEQVEKECVRDWPVPPFFDTYEAMDLGFKDLTVVLFGYYDFRNAKIIIEDEIVSRGVDLHLPVFTQQIIDKEKQLWTNKLTNEEKKVYSRVSDIDYIVMQEISKHSLNRVSFRATKKDDKDAALNNLKVLINSKKIIISPKCITLIRHLKNAKWANKNKKDKFARSQDDGHYDAVDALIYFVRSIEFTKNPYPSHYDLNLKDLYVRNPDKYIPQNIQVFKKIFNRGVS